MFGRIFSKTLSVSQLEDLCSRVDRESEKKNHRQVIDAASKVIDAKRPDDFSQYKLFGCIHARAMAYYYLGDRRKAKSELQWLLSLDHERREIIEDMIYDVEND